MYFGKLTNLHNLSLHLSHIHFYYFSQTLTSLHLSNNQIADQGIQYLSNALQNIEVKQIFSASFSHSFLLFPTDTHFTPPLQQSNRSSRNTISQ